MNPATLHTDPPPVRRRFAANLRTLATDKRFTRAERAEFAKMAGAWERTLSRPDTKRK
jgi:hypothetical protein